ncbi:MAG: aminopeptidase P family protein [Alphaproteobacteria bacterium]|nr:aminopeptidase P family protein [Alphaproteobacteria bacterium]
MVNVLSDEARILCHRERAYLVMDRLGLDALCVSDPRNVLYLSNFDCNLMWNWSWTAFAILPRDRQRPPTLVCSSLDLPSLITNPTWMPAVETYVLHEQGTGEAVATKFRPNMREDARLGPFEREALALYDTTPTIRAPTPEDILRAVMEKLGLTSRIVGFDDMRLALRLKGNLAGLTLRDARDVMREIRLIKTPAEIDRLREAAQRNERALGAAIAATHEGVLWEEVVQAYAIALIREGGRPIYLIRGAGEQARVRLQETDYPIRRGELVFYDGLGQYRRYHGDIGRTAFVGEAPADVRRVFDAVRAGWAEGHARVRPGMRASELAILIRDTMRAHGYPTGPARAAAPHALGLEHFDHPQDRGFYQDFTIEVGCVLNVDMPYIEFGWGSLHLEDTIVVRRDGPEFLTSNKTDLIEIAG